LSSRDERIGVNWEEARDIRPFSSSFRLRFFSSSFSPAFLLFFLSPAFLLFFFSPAFPLFFFSPVRFFSSSFLVNAISSNFAYT